MRAMILADNEKDRRAALKKLLPMQRADFIGLLKAMDGLPVTIRLLDPPLHEFLPKREKLMVDIASLPSADAKHKKGLVEEYREYGAKGAGDLKKILPALLARAEQLDEFNKDRSSKDIVRAVPRALRRIDPAAAVRGWSRRNRPRTPGPVEGAWPAR